MLSGGDDYKGTPSDGASSLLYRTHRTYVTLKLRLKVAIVPNNLPRQQHVFVGVEGSQPADVSTTIYDDALNAAKRQVVLKAFEQANYEHEIAAKVLEYREVPFIRFGDLDARNSQMPSSPIRWSTAHPA